MSNFVHLYLLRNTLYLYTSKNGKVLRHNLNISISDYSPKDISSIENHIKKRRFPPLLEKYRDYIEKEQAFIEGLIVRHRQEYGVFPSIEELKKLIQGGDININSELIPVFNIYLEIREQEFKNRNSISSVKDFISFRNGLQDFEKIHKVTLKISSINNQFLNDYFSFLITKREIGMGFKTKGGLNGRSVKKRFDVVKAFLKWLKERGIDRHTKVLETLKSKSFDLKRITPQVKKITLSIEQIKEIYNYEIEDIKSPMYKVKDMFLFCCSTGLRFSDLIKINKTNITIDYSGKYYLNGNAVKTNEPFQIELSEKTYDIFKRNNYTLNLMSNQKANFYLKKLLQQIEEFQKYSSKYTFKDEQGEEQNYKLFELISFHTARRSFITTLLDNRYSINDIMKRTGHKKATTLEGYVNPNENLGRTIIDIFDY